MKDKFEEVVERIRVEALIRDTHGEYRINLTKVEEILRESFPESVPAEQGEGLGKVDLRNLIEGIDVLPESEISVFGSDNLAIALASYFEGHLARPDDDETDTELGWSKWAIAHTHDLSDRIVAALLTSRPQPGAAKDVRELALDLPSLFDLPGERERLINLLANERWPASFVRDRLDRYDDCQARLILAREPEGLIMPEPKRLREALERGAMRYCGEPSRAVKDCAILTQAYHATRARAEAAERELAEVRADAQRQISEARVKGEEMRAAIIKEIVAVFDKHASYDPHGDGKNAIIHCTDELRADITALATPAEGTI
jgi:hypothetical protein